MSQALIITGMHRSGTSLVAELLQMAGVAIGDRLQPADDVNPRGYFEDVEFLTLQREMVAEAVLQNDEGWPDWGWTERETLREDIWARFEPQARQLAEARASVNPVWGWKDPRTSLLLDFWHRLLPNARYVFVVREPWAVADSVRRLPAEIFNKHPDIAPRIWAFYNRRLLDFAHAHPDRCLFLTIGSLTKTPHKTLDRITSRFGLAFLSHDRTDCANVVHAALARTRAHDKEYQKAFAQEFPFADELWKQLLDASAAQWTGKAPAAAKPAPAIVARARPPRASIIIPCYNDGTLLLEALESVEACKDSLHETIVVDDGSTDPQTLEIFSAVEQRGYRVLHGPNLGVGGACNRGVREAAGEFILPLGSDNRIRPAYIKRSIEVLDAAPDVGVVYGDPELFGDSTGHRALPDFDLQLLHVTNYIDACAVYRKSVWESVGGYDLNLPHGYEDWDFWLSAAEKGWKFYHLPDVMFEYRVRADSLRKHYLDPEKNRGMVRHIAAKHPYFSAHYAEIIGDLHARYVAASNLIQSIESESKKPDSTALDEARARLAEAQARIAELEQMVSWRETAPLRTAEGVVRSESDTA